SHGGAGDATAAAATGKKAGQGHRDQRGAPWTAMPNARSVVEKPCFVHLWQDGPVLTIFYSPSCREGRIVGYTMVVPDRRPSTPGIPWLRCMALSLAVAAHAGIVLMGQAHVIFNGTESACTGALLD